MRKSTLPPLFTAIFLALAYFVAARLSLQLAFAGSNASPIWPPTGIAIAALTFLGLRQAPAILIAAFAANLLTFHDANPSLPLPFWIASVVIALGNTGEALIGAWLLRRDREFPRLFQSQRSSLRFLVVAIGASIVSASVGTATLATTGIIPANLQLTVGLTWWVGDVVGALVFIPLISTWRHSCHSLRSARPLATIANFALPLALITLLAWLIFGPWLRDPTFSRPLVLLIFPALVWLAWRFGLRGASTGVLAVAAFAVSGTTRGIGPFATGHLNESLILLDSFLALAAATALLLAADRAERLREGFANDIRAFAPPGLALLGSLALTVLIWHLLTLDNDKRGEARFALMSEAIQHHMDDRMKDYKRALRGGSGLFAASTEVSRDEWKRYTEAVRVQEALPGIQGMGFSLRIPAADRLTLTRRIQAEGYPDFSIRPAGKRDEYHSIVFLEPFNRRNQRAFGFDMSTESTRRQAMEQARDSGEPTLSARVTLLQEDGTNPQPGILLYLPVYHQGLPTNTPDERRQALRGYVFAPFRAHDLMQGIVGKRWPEVWLEVFDGKHTDIANALYRSPQLDASAPTAARYTSNLSLPLFGHEWTLRLHSTPNFEAGIDRQKSQFVFIAGGLLSLLLFAMMRLQSLTGARANKLAALITEDLQRSQQEVGQREQFANTLFDVTPEALLLVDREGRIVRANQAAARTFRYPADTMLQLSVEALLPAEARHRHVKMRTGFLAGNESRPMGVGRELRAQRSDGSEFPVEVALATVNFDTEKFVIVSLVDITTFKDTEARIRAVSALNVAILDSATVSIISTTPEGIITSFSHSAETLLGYDAEEMIGKQTPALIHLPQEVIARAEEFSRELGRPITPGFEVFVAKSRAHLANTHEWTYVHKNGKHLPVLLAVSALRDKDEQITGFLGIATDISEQKETHRQLESLNTQLDARTREAEAASHAKGDFLANMSHEIRTPMNAVIGLSQLLLDSDLNPKQRDYLNKVQSASRALLGIINDILDYSKIEAGHLAIEAVDFSTAEVIQACSDLFAQQAESKGIALHFLPTDTLPPALHGDPLRLGQILTNLVSNALKFTERGKVEVHLSALAVSETNTIHLHIRVSDTGIGMSPAQTARLFQPFEQADTSTTRKYGGTGLGLSICKRLTELMDGTIRVESQPGAGSTFHVELPCTLAQTLPLLTLPGMDDPLPAAVEGLRVLLVEDNPTNQLIAREFLQRLGCVVTTAQHGGEAIEHVAENDFDLVFMDLQMPVMDGLTATRLLRAMPRGAHLPIVAMTAAATSEDQQATLDAGMNAHLAKPIDRTKLAELLTRFGEAVPALPNTSVRPTDRSFVVPGLALELAVKRMDHNWALLREVLLGFQRDFADANEALDTHLASGDFASATRLVHTVKGLALSIGASTLYETAQHLEAELKHERADSHKRFAGLLGTVLNAIAPLARPPADLVRQPQRAAEWETLKPQLAQLTVMLQKKQGKARTLANEIAAALAETDGESHFAQIHQLIDKLEFNAAREALQTLQKTHRQTGQP